MVAMEQMGSLLPPLELFADGEAVGDPGTRLVLEGLGEMVDFLAVVVGLEPVAHLLLAARVAMEPMVE